MIQHSYTVGLCENRRAEAQFRTKGLVLSDFLRLWRNFARWVIFTGQLRNPWQMLAELLGSAEPRLKITVLLYSRHTCRPYKQYECHPRKIKKLRFTLYVRFLA